MSRLPTLLVVLVSLAWPAASGATGPAGGPITKPYLMAFHACDTAAVDCHGPQNHEVYLAQSSDGAAWSLVPGWQPYAGSVPDVVRRANTIYVFTAAGTVARYDMSAREWTPPTDYTLDDAAAPSGYVDPSLAIDDQGRLVLFGLVSVLGHDPARCAPGEASCTQVFRSATEVRGSDGTHFVADPGDRATVTITSSQGASDADVFTNGKTYFLYISGPTPNSIMVYSSSTLQGSYSPLQTLPNGSLSNGTGGVGSGLFVSGSYWTFAHAGSGGVNVIRRAVTSGFTQQLTASDWSTVVSGPSIGLSATTTVESPGVAINKPGVTPPQTKITSGPPPTTKRTSATIAFRSNPQSTFECALDGGRFGACESPKKYRHQARGPHIFRVRATNWLDYTDPAPAKLRWKVAG